MVYTVKNNKSRSCVQEFLRYLENQRHVNQNTILSYEALSSINLENGNSILVWKFNLSFENLGKKVHFLKNVKKILLIF